MKLAIDGMTHGELLHLSEEAFNGADRCEECLAEIDGINTGEPRWCEDCR